MKLLSKYGIVAVLLSGLFLYSCNDTVEDTRVRVTVTDASGAAVEGATVHLYGQPTDSVYINRLILHDLTKVTNEGGVAVFSFNEFYDQGDNGFAVLQVDVDKDAASGSSHVTLIEEETQQVDVTIQ